MLSSPLTGKLAGFSRLRKTVRDLENFFSLLVIFLAAGLTAGLADFFFQFDASFRWLLFAAGFFYFTALTSSRFVRPLLQKPDIAATAVLLDDRLATGDLFINAWQLLGQRETSFFVHDLAAKAEAEISRVRFLAYLDLRRLRHQALLSAFLVVVLLTLSLLSPRDVLYHADRILFPWENRAYLLFSVRYSVDPGNVNVLAGSDQRVSVSVSGKLRSCVIRYSAGERQTMTEEMTLLTNTSTNSVYGFLFREVNRPFDYGVSMTLERKRKIIESPRYSVGVFYSPVLARISVLYRYPAYTGLDPKLQEESGDVEAVRGTTAEIRADASEDLSSAVCYLAGVPVRCETRGSRIVLAFRVNEDAEYWFKLKDANAMTNVMPVHYAVRVLPDGLPRVRIVRPGRDLEVTAEENVPVSVEASDDNLVRSVRLVRWKVAAYSEQAGSTNVTPLFDGGRREVRQDIGLDLAGIGLSPGDTIHYYADADDGCPYESHRVRSDEYTIRFPSLEDMYKDLDKDEQKNIGALDELKDRQKEYFDKMAEIQEQILQKKDLSYVERKQLESLLQKEKEIQQDTLDVAENLRKAGQNIRQNKMQSQKIAERMEEIDQLLREVADRDMQDQIQKLSETLEKVSLSDKDKQRLGQKLGQEELLRKLDNTARMLKEAKKSRKLNEMVKRAEALVNKQDELARKSSEAEQGKEPSAEELERMKNEQEALKNELDQLQKDIDKLAEQYKDSDPDFNQSLKQENQKIDQNSTQQTMNDSEKDLSRRDYSAAKMKQTKALNDLTSLMNGLKKNVKQREKQNVEELLGAIDGTIINMSGLSREQGRVQENVRTSPLQAGLFPSDAIIPALPADDVPNPSVSDLAESEIVLERVLKSLRKSLQEEIEKTAYVPPEFYSQFDFAGYQMLAAKAALEQKNPYLARKNAENSLAILNQIILQLLKMREQAQKQGEGGDSQKQDAGESMDQLSKQQQSLNSSTRQMKGQSGQQGMTPGEQEYLKELAYQQQMIKGAFDDLLSSNPEETGKMMGDMSGLSKEMDDVVKKMQSGQIDDDLIKRQEKILDRMLDSQKALKVKDESKERKAEQADRSITATPAARNAAEEAGKKRDIRLYRDMEKFPEEYRKIIENYFELLDRGTK